MTSVVDVPLTSSVYFPAQAFLLKSYLLAYNVISCVFWGIVLVRTCQFLISHSELELAAQHNRALPTTATAKLQSLFSLGASKLQSFAARKAPSHRVASTVSALPWPVRQIKDHLSGSYDYKGLGPLVVLTQTGALLEVVHSLTGWVRSDWKTVAMQVASRIWMVWGIVETSQEVRVGCDVVSSLCRLFC
jgi:very-long-chain (3R)-3-hydroxyacyl-CoA dehydratase